MYKLGIDVGGTNTDAVIISDALEVVAEIKRPTSSDVYSGIVDAIRSVMEQSGIDPGSIR
ncbi:MAG: hydantoinase/oxoprolinase family protein, partial [Firmicutes bacterium]|nr:hydantoinase/oxoprolinase family protein [Bacillota bacterium]